MTADCFIIDFEDKRLAYMDVIQARPGKKHILSRNTIFDDVIKMYKEEEMTKEFPTFIQFEDKNGIDAGGVTREMFSAFWEKAYGLLCDGANHLFIHRQTWLSYPL